MNFKTLDFVELSTEEMDACKGGVNHQVIQLGYL